MPPTAVPQPETVEEEPEPDEDHMMAVDAPTSRAGSLLPANSSRRSSLLVSGADNLPVALPILHSLPLPIGISSASDFQSSVYASLADAATPPNNTFLSTLADTQYARFHQPIGIDMALESVAGPSTGTDRRSFGSDEEGTDGQSEEGPLTAGEGKGKSAERKKDLLSGAMDVDRVHDLAA